MRTTHLSIQKHRPVAQHMCLRWCTAAIALLSMIAPVHADRLVGGFDAVGREGHLRTFSEHGVNTHFRNIRPAGKMTLALSSTGSVICEGVEEAYRDSLIKYAGQAAELGVDIYFVIAFFPSDLEALNSLGAYHHAVIQGPTRYHPPGEKPAPSPLEKKYWLGVLLEEAKFVAEMSQTCPNIKGVLIDVEMYAGQIMWRNHCSFDDLTFGEVLARLGRDDRIERDRRYLWLEENGLLEDYFHTQEELVADMARTFRSEIDQVNPQLVLGMLPYEINWFYDGWIKGLGTAAAPALVCTESEYEPGLTTSSFYRRDHLRNITAHVRYLPGLMPKHHSPAGFARQAARCLQAFDGYWIFTTYSLWQPDATKLWGPYLLQADAQQYWQAVTQAEGDVSSTKMFDELLCPGHKLLSNNRYYPGARAALDIQVSYSQAPDILFFTDDDALFDGGEYEPTATLAWHAVKDQTITVTADLGRDVTLQRIRLAAGTSLARYPAVKAGTIEIATSHDETMFYPIAEEKLVTGAAVRDAFDYDSLGIRARYLRVTFTATDVLPHSVWSLSEMAFWGI